MAGKREGALSGGRDACAASAMESSLSDCLLPGSSTSARDDGGAATALASAAVAAALASSSTAEPGDAGIAPVNRITPCVVESPRKDHGASGGASRSGIA